MSHTGGDKTGEREPPSPLGQAREIDRWMYEFIARLAHDVRAPLGAIRMWTHVLRGSDDGGDKLTGLNAIDASVRSHSDMIALLVDMSSAIVGRLAVDRRPVDPLVQLRAALELVAPEARLQGIALESLDVSPRDAAPLVRADARRLEQALAALLSFAASSARAGGRVGTRATVSADGLDVRISATEGAIGPGDIAGLFTPYQSHGMAQAHRDFGLGLAFAQAITLSHGGALEAEHAGPGHGLVFRLHLPLAEPDAPG